MKNTQIMYAIVMQQLVINYNLTKGKSCVLIHMAQTTQTYKLKKCYAFFLHVFQSPQVAEVTDFQESYHFFRQVAFDRDMALEGAMGKLARYINIIHILFADYKTGIKHFAHVI